MFRTAVPRLKCYTIKISIIKISTFHFCGPKTFYFKDTIIPKHIKISGQNSAVFNGF